MAPGTQQARPDPSFRQQLGTFDHAQPSLAGPPGHHGRDGEESLAHQAAVDQLAHDNPALYERGFKIISDFRIGVAVKKGNTDLANAIYDSMRALGADGTQKAIFTKYNVDTALIVTPELRNK